MQRDRRHRSIRGQLVAWVGLLAAIGCTEGGPNSVVLSGTVTELVVETNSPGAPLPAVSVCQFGSLNCAQTDENGHYELPLLFNSEVAISYEKAGYGSVLVARRTGTQNFTGNAILATDATLSEYAALLDTPYPPTSTGALTMTAFRGPIADDVRIEGVTYSVLGSNGRSFYLDDSGLPDSTLTSTQALGAGGFIELAPVTVELQVGGTAVNCTSEESWLAASSNRFLFPIRRGFWTQSTMSCE